ncbi:MAG: ATP-binding protein [Thaumarchaeota archaeon]|nr:MAG: ATP-binding protein [Nitrososphaerota archaeon]
MASKSEGDLTIVIFDVAGEYAVHLVDLLASGGRILTNELIEDAGQFYNSQAIPESLEDEVGPREIQKALEGLYKAGVVERLALQEAGGLDLAWIQTLLEKTVGDAKAGGTTAIIALEKLSSDFYTARGLQPATRLSDLDDDAKKALTSLLEEIRVKSHEKSGIRLEAEQILEKIMTEKAERGTKEGGLTPEKLAYELATSKAPRLNILYLPDPLHARMAASRLISRLLYLRKRLGNRGRILIVLDEAQEYIPDNPNDKQMTMTSNIQVEALLRQGRKYRVHCWLATQRVAHLNVSALQQLHSYFVSTLPRMYDRMVVADSFALPYEVLERSAQLESGEWIFVSYKATKQKGVPVFVRTENNESLVAEYLRSRK